MKKSKPTQILVPSTKLLRDSLRKLHASSLIRDVPVFEIPLILDDNPVRLIQLSIVAVDAFEKFLREEQFLRKVLVEGTFES